MAAPVWWAVAALILGAPAAAAPAGHAGAARAECKDCHEESRRAARYDAVRPWLESRHAAAGVTCVACHLERGTGGEAFYAAVTAHGKEDAHAALQTRPGARENKGLFVEICGGCHQERLVEFQASVHGPGRHDGTAAASCIDCHDAHRAPPVSAPAARLYRGNDLKTCGHCHRETHDSYMKTFHGKQFALGNPRVPTCSYCHIGHEAPANDPASAVHVGNIGALCAGCHGDAVRAGSGADATMVHNLSRESTARIAHFQDPVHLGPFSVASLINSTYLSMIVGIVGFFTLLSTRDFIKKTRGRGAARRSRRGEKTVRRFSVAWRLQHFFWASSFIVLAATGLSVKFPDSIFSEAVVWLVGGEAMRSVVHRLAALLFMALALTHLAPYLLGLRSPDKILLTKKDFVDAFLHTSYLFDRTDKMPLMYRYTWYQKLEYWATVIGASIVISTGLVMWGFAPLAETLPVALVFYAQLIHGWEAILAVLVIFVQHFYHAVLNPLVFPMDLSWLTGKTNYAVMEHDHPLELMEIEAAEGGTHAPDEG